MSAFFIRRPVATCLLTLAVALPGAVAFNLLPIASLPMVDLPSIGVNASLPGAGPETVAAVVATPLERALGAISGLTEMTSTSTQGSTRISLQFDLDRDINGAARDVQSAISAARGLLPSSLPTQPTYRKANAAGSPVLAIALTSKTMSQDQLYDVAFTVLGQKIAQVPGVGQVGVNGSALRSVRVEVDPHTLNQMGIGLEQVRRAIAASNSVLATGHVEDESRRWQIDVNDQARIASDYRDLIVAWRNGAAVRLSEVATVRDSVSDLRNAGSSGGEPAVILAVFNQPRANVVEMVDAVKALLPRVQPLLPGSVDLKVVIDRSTSIRKTLSEVEFTLLLSIALVIGVTWLFLRSLRATLIPTVAIPVSLLGTFAVMYLLGFSLNNLSLMAIIIATGFVVDDAIVVVENISRHIEDGMEPVAAALRGAREVSFTVMAMSTALVSVFIPLLFMGGMVGRLFREFAVSLAVAVLVSLVVSLTATPMLCARLLRKKPQTGPVADAVPALSREPWWRRAGPVLGRTLITTGSRLHAGYARSLDWALRAWPLVLLLLVGVTGCTVHLYTVIPKGFFPQQDTGRLSGQFRTDQSTSFDTTRSKITQMMTLIGKDPDIDTYYEYTGGSGGGQANAGAFFARLKPREERQSTAQEVVARLRPQLAGVPGASLFLTAQQELNIGARQGGAQYQYSILASDIRALASITPRLRAALAKLPELTDVSTDFQDRGLKTSLVVDRAAAARLGITAQQIDGVLSNAFGQRLVSTIYEPLNQYYVVLNLAPAYTRSPSALEDISLFTAQGGRIPLSAIARWEDATTPLSVNHQGGFVAATISFNLAPGVALDQATRAVETTFADVRLQTPGAAADVQGQFAGTARAFQQSLDSQPWLILAALLTVYVVLGILYESFLHPLTILSTLPSAGIGALLALQWFKTEFTIIAFIGVILLVGIVIKNAIIMIDAALQAQADRGLDAAAAIRLAAAQRFRPILMTTCAALFGALPLVLGIGDGAEVRQPLGIAIVGGLLFSQMLTLYTTPVVFLALSRLRRRVWRRPVLPAPTPAGMATS